MKKEAEWIVNDLGELGVKIGDDFNFLYKGRSYDGGTMWRPVYKREFGECCHPLDYKEYCAQKTRSKTNFDETFMEWSEKKIKIERKAWTERDEQLFGIPYEWRPIPPNPTR